MRYPVTQSGSPDPLDEPLTTHDIMMLAIAAAAAIGAAVLFAFSF